MSGYESMREGRADMNADVVQLSSNRATAEPGTRIGAYVLDSLTTGLYRYPFDAVREYVANARDSIVEAIGRELITAREGRIKLSINTAERSLSIRDSGVGIDAAHARRRLIDVGMSSKSLADPKKNAKNIGFRGIGRLGGIAYCRTLEFRTSAVGEAVETIVRIDCRAFKAGIDSARTNPYLEAAALLDSCVTVETDTAKKDEHWFEVRMLDVAPSVSEFLDVDKLNDYLCQSAPVGTDNQRWMLQGEIDKFTAANDFSVPVVNIVIWLDGKQSRVVWRPYKSTYHTSGGKDRKKIDIGGVGFIEPTKPGLGYWGWYGVSGLEGQIDDQVAAGIRIRMHGMGFGDAAIMSGIFRESAISSERFNGWYIGEIHITDPAVIPNARRDGFEETEAWAAIRADIVSHARTLSSACHRASTARNASASKAKLIVDGVDAKTGVLLKTGIASEGKRGEVIKSIEDTAAALERLKARTSDETEAEGIDRELERLRATADKVRDTKAFASSELEVGMDRGQKALLRKILGALQDTLDEATFTTAYAAIGKALKAKRKK
jgi:hypothetical protein